MKMFTPDKRAGFTLVEMLVSTTIIALIMVVMLGMTNQTSQTWRYTTEKVEKFQGARDGFEAMTRRLSQATLNTYWDYMDANQKFRTQFLAQYPHDNSALSKFVPYQYGRMSELRFASGPVSTGPNALLDSGEVTGIEKYITHGVFFQALLGQVSDDVSTRTKYGDDYPSMDNALNTWGYFVETGDYDERPSFITENIQPKRWRSRLMEFRLPCEKMGLYDSYSVDYTNNWFQKWLNLTPTGGRPVRVLAENVTALVIWPKLAKQEEDTRVTTTPAQSVLCPNYTYRSNPPLTGGKPTPYNPGVVWNSSTTDDVTEKGGVNPINQLPPVVQVTMVAVDERSAKRLAELYGKGTDKYTMGLPSSNLFQTACLWNRAPLTAPTQYETDLAAYEAMLVKERATYRVFSTNVSIRGAKWSRSQVQ